MTIYIMMVVVKLPPTEQEYGISLKPIRTYTSTVEREDGPVLDVDAVAVW